ncbi:lysine--tRNA ligase [Candidatus Uhrbacteria bacterium]|nr:lysine--tRNA ligase [Candidatus Uhrbacteria bacterium]
MEFNDERDVRIKKRDALVKKGLNPYPSIVQRTHTCRECFDQFETLSTEKKEVVVAGRVRSIRRHGGSTFVVLEDESERLQLFIRKDEVGDEQYAVLKDLIDMGDFLEGAGALFLTKTQEKTLHITKFRILAKALVPLPDQWYGLHDVETRYRHRELDLLSNLENRERFKVRSKLVSAMRRFLDERDFLEVETPILQPIPGGANARPFSTHHNALDADFYLRIAPELYLKRLIVGGFERVYEIGRLFRNEGIDHAHSPEFTSMELYWAYVPTRDAFIDFLEEMMHVIIMQSIGALRVNFEGGTIDFGCAWKRVSFREAVLDATGIDIDKYRTEEALVVAVKKKKLDIDFSNCVGVGEHYDQLFKKTARPAMKQPTWVFDYPIELKPLTKVAPDDPTKSASVQLIVEGFEIINAYYHELNDPLDQRKRFMEQETLRAHGSTEAHYLDNDFLLALEYGMPPTSGMGIGIDRLVCLLTNTPNVKDVILFPTLRLKRDE